jgi:hypothetical protein
VLTDLATLVLADSSICRIRLYNGVPFVSGKLVGFFVTVPSPHTIEVVVPASVALPELPSLGIRVCFPIKVDTVGSNPSEFFKLHHHPHFLFS